MPLTQHFEEEEDVVRLLEKFGGRLVELGNPTWRNQRDALMKAKWMKGD